MITKKDAEKWLSINPQFRKRSLMYQATAEYLGLTSDQVEKAITFHRRLQQILPNDKKGVQLEKEWRSKEGMKSLVEFAEEVFTPPGYVRLNGQLLKIVK